MTTLASLTEILPARAQIKATYQKLSSNLCLVVDTNKVFPDEF